MALIGLLISSCNVIKRLNDDESLLTKNTVVINGEKGSTEKINSIISQTPNSSLFKLPLRLHIYNLARTNIDSIVNAKYNLNLRKNKRLTNLLSKKQFEVYKQSKINFNSWLKETGEAPVIVNDEKTKKINQKLENYYFSEGWFNAKANYKIDSSGVKRSAITYSIETGEPYILDSISSNISTAAIDTIYQDLKKESLLKQGEQFREDNFTNERDRINTSLRNLGFYHFGVDNITFDIDTISKNKLIPTKLIISDRVIRDENSVRTEPFKAYKIKDVNVFIESLDYKDSIIRDSISYKNYKFYSAKPIKYRPQALVNAIFINQGDLYKDQDRSQTYKHLNYLDTFNYPNIEYVENEEDTTLTANIKLLPQKKFDMNFSLEVNQSNIQTIGIAFSTGLITRNIFKGAETLNISAIGSIGSSKDGSENSDSFFDINEFGINAKLTIPRLFFPFNTERVIPKSMSPKTNISLGTTGQTNIGLDKQTISGIFNYNWRHNKKVTNNFDVFNIQFIKNLNIDNYFGVYVNSYNRLNDIAQDTGYIGEDESLGVPEEADQFINDVLNGNTSLEPSDPDYVDVDIIDERKQRLTEDNLVYASNFQYTKNNRTDILDNSFSIFRVKFELAGNLLSLASSAFGADKNENDRYDIFGVAFSQYVKTEFDYIKYWDFGDKNILAFRTFFGIAIPYGNSNSIPFSKSFFAGGPNDNRAWSAYNLGPGSSINNDEFSEANMKFLLSLEQRFNLFGDLDSAVFIDAGNIWNVLDSTTDEKSTFSGIESLNDIALGSGFGLRYDFTYFVLRGDIGFKTYDPIHPEGERWFKDFNFNNAVYNIGVNYPF